MILKITENDKFRGQPMLKLLQGLSLSNRMIKRLKYREDGIQVNGERVTVRYILKSGDEVYLATEDSESSESASPSDVKAEIIYEDSEIIVADKPPFMPTHPSHGHHDDTLANALASYFSKKNVPFVFRPINRLDRNTSGLVIVAKNKFSAAALTKAMKGKRIRKTYIAYLSGRLEDPSETVEYMGMRLGIINMPMHRTAASIIVREVCSPDTPDAEEALTYYRILVRCDECTEVEIFPQTGRTHQLRVHFAAIGHPILGDDMYGTKSDIISRHALHAAKLVFPLPSPIGEEKNERELTLTSPLPKDMELIKQRFFSNKGQEDEQQKS